MMMNLFSSFDPSTSFIFSSNWLAMISPVIFIPLIFWLIPSRNHMIFMMLFKYINSEIKNNISYHNMKIMMIFITLFWFIICNNMLGLYPYIFTATSHLVITLTLALPFWILLMMFGWINKSFHMFSHLVPNGTPMILAPFMVLIETTSNIIRPITLSVRLAANMIAGHLLLTLLSEISETMPSMYLYSFPALIILLILEYSVAAIQSYVFITLLSLYINEVN